VCSVQTHIDMSYEVRSTVVVHGGRLMRISHESKETKTSMIFAIYLPFQSPVSDVADKSVPSILYLSGLTCTDENVCFKASGIFKKLFESKIAFIAPDTSPRGANIEGEDASWDFGTGAGFYLDALQEPWSKNYRMYSYITDELMTLLSEKFPCLDPSKRSVTGHSMGGLGALTIALKNQSLFRSVSAFAPICHPSTVTWGQKAFTSYLGQDNKEEWAKHDPTELLLALKGSQFDDILIDVGTADSFLEPQLKPQDFASAADQVGQKVTIRYQEGYDHSYYFICSFIEDHVAFHAERLMR
jgi:S-formylglutathione hydrolase